MIGGNLINLIIRVRKIDDYCYSTECESLMITVRHHTYKSKNQIRKHVANSAVGLKSFNLHCFQLIILLCWMSTGFHWFPLV